MLFRSRRCIEGFFEAPRAEERRGPPLRIDLTDFFGDFDFAFRADFLQDEAHGKERSEIVGTDGLQCSGMQRRRCWDGEIGLNVVPGFRNFRLRKMILDGIHAAMIACGMGVGDGLRTC